MSYDVLPTLCFAVVALAAIQAVTVYSVVRLLVSGRSLFERREPERPRIVGMGER